MPVPSSMSDLNTTESSNSPSGSENPISSDNHIRALGAIVRRTNAKGADIASSGTVNLGASTGEFVDITGTTTITSLGTIAAGIVRTVRFTGALTLTHNATSLILPTAANIATANGDVAQFRSLGSGNWLCVSYLKAGGGALSGDFVPVGGGTFSGDVSVPDDAYSESSWNANLEVPTKNAVRDELESVKTTVNGLIQPIGMVVYDASNTGSYSAIDSNGIFSGTITRVGDGIHRATFSTAQPDVNYLISHSSTSLHTRVHQHLTTVIDLKFTNSSNTADDPSYVSLMVYRIS